MFPLLSFETRGISGKCPVLKKNVGYSYSRTRTHFCRMFGRHVEALKKGRVVGEKKVGTKRRRGREGNDKS